MRKGRARSAQLRRIEPSIGTDRQVTGWGELGPPWRSPQHSWQADRSLSARPCPLSPTRLNAKRHRFCPCYEKPKQAIELARLLGWMESGVPNAHRRRHKWMLLLPQRLEAKLRHDQAKGVAQPCSDQASMTPLIAGRTFEA